MRRTSVRNIRRAPAPALRMETHARRSGRIQLTALPRRCNVDPGALARVLGWDLKLSREHEKSEPLEDFSSVLCWQSSRTWTSAESA